MKDSEISKLISYWLRHKPEDANLKLDKFGWADIDEILIALKNNNIIISKSDLVQINSSFDKIRWHIDLENNKIKATHGHSISIELEYLPSSPPEDLFHGTSIDNVIGIIEKGLTSQSRLYVHLTDNYDLAKKIGKRHGKPVVIELNIQKLLKDDWQFYKTEQNVWLTNDIPLDYLIISTWTFSIDDKTKNDFLEQLKTEVYKSHQLYDKLKDLELVGRCFANDDCIFKSSKDSKYYFVHLTWAKGQLDDIWPFTKIYASFQDCIIDCLNED